MSRPLSLCFSVLAVALGMGIVLVAASASAQSTPPPGTLFYSDFGQYSNDWQSIPNAIPPAVTQLPGEVDVEATASENYGRFSSQMEIDPGSIAIEDLEISLEMTSVDADRVDLWLAWFGSGSWIDSTRVLDVFSTTDLSAPLIADLAGITAPAGATDIVLLFFVRGGSAIFDEVSLYPDSSVIVPEPGIALLLGLGLAGLAVSRRRTSD